MGQIDVTEDSNHYVLLRDRPPQLQGPFSLIIDDKIIIALASGITLIVISKKPC
jgi:hypothetical protein